MIATMTVSSEEGELTEQERQETTNWQSLERLRKHDPHLFALITLCTLADNLREAALHGHKDLFMVLASKEFSHGLKTLRLSYRDRFKNFMSALSADTSIQSNPSREYMLLDAFGPREFLHKFSRHSFWQG